MRIKCACGSNNYSCKISRPDLFNVLVSKYYSHSKMTPRNEFIVLTFVRGVVHLNFVTGLPLCLLFLGCKAMQTEKKWHILLCTIIMLITSSQCMDSKEAKLKERRTLLDLILQVIGDNQRDKPVSRRITSGLFTVSQDLKFSSREKASYSPKHDRSRPMGKL